MVNYFLTTGRVSITKEDGVIFDILATFIGNESVSEIRDFYANILGFTIASPDITDAEYLSLFNKSMVDVKKRIGGKLPKAVLTDIMTRHQKLHKQFDSLVKSSVPELSVLITEYIRLVKPEYSMSGKRNRSSIKLFEDVTPELLTPVLIEAIIAADVIPDIQRSKGVKMPRLYGGILEVPNDYEVPTMHTLILGVCNCIKGKTNPKLDSITSMLKIAIDTGNFSRMGKHNNILVSTLIGMTLALQADGICDNINDFLNSYNLILPCLAEAMDDTFHCTVYKVEHNDSVVILLNNDVMQSGIVVDRDFFKSLYEAELLDNITMSPKSIPSLASIGGSEVKIIPCVGKTPLVQLLYKASGHYLTENIKNVTRSNTKMGVA